MGQIIGKNKSKIWVVNKSKTFLIMLSNLKLFQKEQRAIQETTEATGDLTGNKIADKITRSQNFYHRIIKKQLQMSMIRKYLKKDISLQKKSRTLLII